MSINVFAPPPQSHAPAGTDKSANAVEDQVYTVQLADFGFTDPQDSPANNFLSVQINSLPAAGTLSLNGSAITSGQLPLTVLTNAIGQGKLTYQGPTNANGTNLARFTFQVKDDGGTASGGADLDPIANSMSFNVASVNDAPVGIDRVVTTPTHTGSPIISYTFQVSDFNFDDPNDLPQHNGLAAVIIGSGLPAASQGLLTLAGVPVTPSQVIAASDISSGLLQFTPAANFSGQPTFTFQVQDDGGTAFGGID